jgi:hypothetical protein
MASALRSQYIRVVVGVVGQRKIIGQRECHVMSAAGQITAMQIASTLSKEASSALLLNLSPSTQLVQPTTSISTTS